MGLHTAGTALPLHLEQPKTGWSPLFEEAGCRIQSFASLSPTSPPNLFRRSVHSPYSSPAESGRKSDCWRQKSPGVTCTEPQRPPLRSPAWGSLPPWAPSAASTSQAQKAALHGWDRSFSTNPLSPWHGHFWDRYCPVAWDQAGENSVLRHTQHSTGPPWLPCGLPCSPWCLAHPRAPAPAPSSAGPSGGSGPHPCPRVPPEPAAASSSPWQTACSDLLLVELAIPRPAVQAGAPAGSCSRCSEGPFRAGGGSQVGWSFVVSPGGRGRTGSGHPGQLCGGQYWCPVPSMLPYPWLSI